MVNQEVIGGEMCSFVRNWRVNMRSFDSFLKEQSQSYKLAETASGAKGISHKA